MRQVRAAPRPPLPVDRQLRRPPQPPCVHGDARRGRNRDSHLPLAGLPMYVVRLTRLCPAHASCAARRVPRPPDSRAAQRRSRLPRRALLLERVDRDDGRVAHDSVRDAARADLAPAHDVRGEQRGPLRIHGRPRRRQHVHPKGVHATAGRAHGGGGHAPRRGARAPARVRARQEKDTARHHQGARHVAPLDRRPRLVYPRQGRPGSFALDGGCQSIRQGAHGQLPRYVARLTQTFGRPANICMSTIHGCTMSRSKASPRGGEQRVH